MSPIHSRTRTAALAVAIALSLGGCQMLGMGGQSRSALHTQALPENFGAEQLEEGRAALVENRTSDAIAAFMIAKSYPEHAPAAFNGLAVAYSRLGRSDLTERFFQTAIALAPEEEKYRSNLALFYTRNEMPRAAEPVLAVSLPEAQPSATAAATMQVASAPQRVEVVKSLRGGITVQSSSTAAHRVSVNEVRIGSEHVARHSRQAVIQVGRAATPSYPIRFALSEIRTEDGRAEPKD